MTAEATFVRNGRAGHRVLKAGDGPAVSVATGFVCQMLTMVLDQSVQFATASVQNPRKVQRNISRVVGIGFAKLVGPVRKQL